MKLMMNRGSPFARKVRIAIREIGLAESVEEIDTTVSPVAANPDLARANPLLKIPALQISDTTALYDSRVICEYLDDLHAGMRLFPSGTERCIALRRQALADGLMDAAVLCRYELAVRPEGLRWSEWIDGQRRKVDGALGALETEAREFGRGFNIGHVSVVSGLGYLDFRFPDWSWRERHPALDAWFRSQAERPSVATTSPA